MTNEKLERVAKSLDEMDKEALRQLSDTLYRMFRIPKPVVQQPVVVEPEEQTEFSVFMKDVGSSRVSVIKTIRELKGFGLKESKEFVEAGIEVQNSGELYLLIDEQSKEQADVFAEKMREAGAEVIIK